MFVLFQMFCSRYSILKFKDANEEFQQLEKNDFDHKSNGLTIIY